MHFKTYIHTHTHTHTHAHTHTHTHSQLVIMTPKNLLRDPDAKSPISYMTEGRGGEGRGGEGKQTSYDPL